MTEFSGIRAQLYKECLKDFTDTRVMDIKIMHQYLSPSTDETILEVGAGSGFFKELEDKIEFYKSE